MGNVQQRCRGAFRRPFELDRPEAIYLPNETISGRVRCSKNTDASLVLIGVIYYKRRRKTGMEKCQIRFLNSSMPLTSSKSKESFQLQLDNGLPPSLNDRRVYPRIVYSINLIRAKSPDQVEYSLPIRVCPRAHIDRPLLLTPLYFGPVENQHSGVKLEIKVNRAVFTFDDMIQIYYELQNPRQVELEKVQISLGIYHSIDSHAWQKDLCHGIENFLHAPLQTRLIRNKVLLNIPKKTYLPPTYRFQYGRGNDRTSFNLSIDYKIQFRIYFAATGQLWQVDVPIVLCTHASEQTEMDAGIMSPPSEIDANAVSCS